MAESVAFGRQHQRPPSRLGREALRQPRQPGFEAAQRGSGLFVAAGCAAQPVDRRPPVVQAADRAEQKHRDAALGGGFGPGRVDRRVQVRQDEQADAGPVKRRRVVERIGLAQRARLDNGAQFGGTHLFHHPRIKHGSLEGETNKPYQAGKKTRNLFLR